MKTNVLTALGAVLAVCATSLAAPPKTAPSKTAPQKITIALPAGYSASNRVVRAGKPVALTFVLKSEAGCGNEVMVPAAKWKRTLKVGQSATVVFTPTKTGPLAFACGMNHMKGSFVVR